MAEAEPIAICASSGDNSSDLEKKITGSGEISCPEGKGSRTVADGDGISKGKIISFLRQLISRRNRTDDIEKELDEDETLQKFSEMVATDPNVIELSVIKEKFKGLPLSKILNEKSESVKRSSSEPTEEQSIACTGEAENAETISLISLSDIKAMYDGK